jgi:hypothetical protein
VQGGYKKIAKKIKKQKIKKTVRYYPGWLGERGLCVSELCLLCAVMLSPALWCSVGVSQRQSNERKKKKVREKRNSKHLRIWD